MESQAKESESGGHQQAEGTAQGRAKRSMALGSAGGSGAHFSDHLASLGSSLQCARRKAALVGVP